MSSKWIFQATFTQSKNIQKDNINQNKVIQEFQFIYSINPEHKTACHLHGRS